MHLRFTTAHDGGRTTLKRTFVSLQRKMGQDDSIVSPRRTMSGGHPPSLILPPRGDRLLLAAGAGVWTVGLRSFLHRRRVRCLVGGCVAVSTARPCSKRTASREQRAASREPGVSRFAVRYSLHTRHKSSAMYPSAQHAPARSEKRKANSKQRAASNAMYPSAQHAPARSEQRKANSEQQAASSAMYPSAQHAPARSE